MPAFPYALPKQTGSCSGTFNKTAQVLAMGAGVVKPSSTLLDPSLSLKVQFSRHHQSLVKVCSSGVACGRLLVFHAAQVDILQSQNLLLVQERKPPTASKIKPQGNKMFPR